MQFAPDGKRLAAGRGGNLQTFALIDLATGKDVTSRTIAEDDRSEYQFLGFTPDGKAWGLRGFALVDWVSGQERSRIIDRGRWRAALSPDGKVLAGIDVNGKVMLWEAATGKALRTLTSRPTAAFGLLAFSPDGTTLATAGFPPQRFGYVPDDRRANLALWNVATRAERAGAKLTGSKADLGMPSTPRGNESARSMRFTSNGRRLAVACRVVLPGQAYPQTVLRLWDAATLKEKGQLQSEAHGSLRDYAFAPDGKTVAIAWFGKVASQGSSEPTVYAPAPVTIHELGTGKKVAHIPPPSSGFAAVGFSRDGTLLATQDNQGVVKLYERAGGKENHGD